VSSCMDPDATEILGRRNPSDTPKYSIKMIRAECCNRSETLRRVCPLRLRAHKRKDASNSSNTITGALASSARRLCYRGDEHVRDGPCIDRIDLVENCRLRKFSRVKFASQIYQNLQPRDCSPALVLVARFGQVDG
jgi:hypothetical protein